MIDTSTFRSGRRSFSLAVAMAIRFSFWLEVHCMQFRCAAQFAEISQTFPGEDYETTDIPARLSGISALGLAAAAVPLDLAQPSTAWPNRNRRPPASPEISGWVTAGQEKFAAVPKTQLERGIDSPRRRSYSRESSQEIPVHLRLRRRLYRRDVLHVQPPHPATRDQLFHEMFIPRKWA